MRMMYWMRRLAVGLLLAWLLVMGTHCSQPPVIAPTDTDGTHTVYVVQHAWHAGLVFPREALEAYSGSHRWNALDDFEGHKYIEVGWGDAEYYPNPEPGLGTLLRAGLWPTASTLHLAAFNGPVPDAFPRQQIVAIEVSDEAIARAAAFVQRSFAEDAPEPIADGLYYESAFYASRLSYHVFNNCNHWAAFALQTMGCAMRPTRTLRVERLLRDAADCGRLVQSR